MRTIECFAVGPMAVNAYVVADTATREACLIDPGAEPGRIERFLRAHALTLAYIVNTHGHGDHIAANGYFKAPVYIHRLDKDFLADPEKNLSSLFGFPLRLPQASRLLEDGDRLSVGTISLEVRHTPGHTPGSISLVTDGIAFTGDTLFAGGVGRTDFAYGDGERLIQAIRQRLLTLDDRTVVYPGHGASSTIGHERKTNPFL